MFGYYLKLGLVHLRKSPVLTGLMVITLAVGIAASMSTLTVLYTMSGDPIPSKSDRLFVPLLDHRPIEVPGDDVEPPEQLTYRDATALLAARRGVRQTVLYGTSPAINPDRPDVQPFLSEGLAVHRDFFPMFDVPLVRGAAWTADDDARGARVVVVRAALADKLFGGVDPIGRSIRLGEHDFRVVGVVADDWRPLPKFYRLIAGPTWEHEEHFVPFATAVALEFDPQGSVNCYGNNGRDQAGFAGLLSSECVWLQYWTELASPDDAAGYTDALAAYAGAQRALGRFPRKDNHRLYDVMGWLAALKIVSQDSRLQTYLAFGFLLVCLVNVVGLLLAKFTARAGEIGVRRALGASRGEIFRQYLAEVAVLGLVGGAIGLLLTFGCLWLIGRQSPALRVMAHMDWVMLAATFALAVGASVVAGLLPIWRASRVQPAVQLKSH